MKSYFWLEASRDLIITLKIEFPPIFLLLVVHEINFTPDKTYFKSYSIYVIIMLLVR